MIDVSLRNGRYDAFNMVNLEFGKVYGVNGAWGYSHCRYIGKEGKHHLFRSVKGKWLVSFTDFEIKHGIASGLSY